MKYSQPNNTSKSILHQFSKDKNITHYIGGKKWEDISMSFREVKTNSDKRKFGFVIRYGNPEDSEWKLNQFDMDEDEIKQFLDIVYETVYNPPKFKENYCIGDKFIIPHIKVVDSQGNYFKEITYTNVESKLVKIFEINKSPRYVLDFDNNIIVVTKDCVDGLKIIE